MLIALVLDNVSPAIAIFALSSTARVFQGLLKLHQASVSSTELLLVAQEDSPFGKRQPGVLCGLSSFPLLE